MPNKRNSKKREYLEASIVAIIFILIIFILDLPKVSSFIILGVIFLFCICLYELLSLKNNKSS